MSSNFGGADNLEEHLISKGKLKFVSKAPSIEQKWHLRPFEKEAYLPPRGAMTPLGLSGSALVQGQFSGENVKNFLWFQFTGNNRIRQTSSRFVPQRALLRQYHLCHDLHRRKYTSCPFPFGTGRYSREAGVWFNRCGRPETSVVSRSLVRRSLKVTGPKVTGPCLSMAQWPSDMTRPKTW